MRVGYLSFLALNAAGVMAAPTADASAPEVTNIDNIADLAAAAYEKAQELVETQAKRGSTCNLGNIRIRREW